MIYGVLEERIDGNKYCFSLIPLISVWLRLKGISQASFHIGSFSIVVVSFERID